MLSQLVKILQYLIFFLILPTVAFSQSNEWFVFKGANPPKIKYESRDNWLPIDIFGNDLRIAGNNSNKNVSHPGNNFGLIESYPPSLPENSIVCMAADNNGYIWVGTESFGLAKYDGYTWEVYNSSNSGLPDNSIYSIAVDSKNTIWIGTRGGLAKFNGTKWKAYNASNSLLPGNVVYSLAIERNGTVWIGTSRGLARLKNNSWRIFTPLNSKLRNEFISALNIDAHNKLWVGTFGGLLKFNGASWQTISGLKSILAKADIYAINFDKKNDVVVDLWGGGVASLNGGRWILNTTKNSSLPDDYVSSTLIDKNGDKWIGTLSGIVRIEKNNWVISDTINSSLPSNEVYSMVNDKSGNLWIGTKAGVAVYRKGGIRTLPGGIPAVNVIAEKNNIMVNWIAENDSMSYGYEVEEKIEDKDWETIGFTKTEIKDTSFTGEYNFEFLILADGKAKYRIRQLFYDGSYNVSDVAQIKIDLPKKYEMKLNYLDPSNKEMTVEYELPVADNVEIKMFNMFGRAIGELVDEEKSAGRYQVKYDCSHLPGGFYYFKIHTTKTTILKASLFLK